MQDVLNMVALNRYILICQGGENEIHVLLRWAERVFTPSGARAERGRVERGG